VYDPIYEDPRAYRISQTAARKRLGLPRNKKLALYFGNFFFSKGADILLKAAQKFPNKNVMFVFAGNTTSANFALNRKDFNRKNIILDDRFIPEDEAVFYLRAADVVVLPYRRFYKDGTSGLLVQAALAERPAMVPDIFPFNAVVRTYKTGMVFTLESPSALARSIAQALTSEGRGGYARYIHEIESWKELAKAALM
jgi:glycosyltransferase involved in cell wall biosynthesis